MSGESTATILLEEAIRGFLWSKHLLITTDMADEWTGEIMKMVEEHLGTDHFVNFDETGWFIEHSFACRLAGTLGTCKWNVAIREVYTEDDPDNYGRWRITDVDDEGCPSLERAPWP